MEDCNRIASSNYVEYKMGMPRIKPRRNAEEDRRLTAFIEQIGTPREPTVRIYRLDSDGKQTRLGVMSLDYCDEESVREQFGPGTFLLRTVRSNGTYGPST